MELGLHTQSKIIEDTAIRAASGDLYKLRLFCSNLEDCIDSNTNSSLVRDNAKTLAVAYVVIKALDEMRDEETDNATSTTSYEDLIFKYGLLLTQMVATSTDDAMQQWIKEAITWWENKLQEVETLNSNLRKDWEARGL